MADRKYKESPEKKPQVPELPAEAGDSFSSDIPVGMTLDSIISLTGEMEHLNELVILHVGRSGGFTCTASYFAIVTPILDMLEAEIRFRYHQGMSKEQLKLVIQDWIDTEIAGLEHGK